MADMRKKLLESVLGKPVHSCTLCGNPIVDHTHIETYEGEPAHSICTIRKYMTEEREKQKAQQAKQFITVEIYQMTCHCCFATYYENADDTLDYCPHCGGDQFNNENIDEQIEIKFELDNKTGLVRAAGLEPADGTEG